MIACLDYKFINLRLVDERLEIIYMLGVVEAFLSRPRVDNCSLLLAAVSGLFGYFE